MDWEELARRIILFVSCVGGFACGIVLTSLLTDYSTVPFWIPVGLSVIFSTIVYFAFSYLLGLRDTASRKSSLKDTLIRAVRALFGNGEAD